MVLRNHVGIHLLIDIIIQYYVMWSRFSFLPKFPWVQEYKGYFRVQSYSNNAQPIINHWHEVRQN